MERNTDAIGRRMQTLHADVDDPGTVRQSRAARMAVAGYSVALLPPTPMYVVTQQ